MTGKFVLKSTGRGRFSFNLVAGNGRTIFTSESYTSKAAALDSIESVRVNAMLEGNFVRRSGKNRQPYFVLKAVNQELIGKSELYVSARNMEKGIASVKANAASAGLEDLTLNK